MKSLLLLALMIFGTDTFAATYALYRKVEYLPQEGSGPYEWRLFSEDHVEMSPQVYAVFTPYGYKVRAEGLWLKNKGIVGGSLHCDLSLEKNEFPMDDTWDVLWTEKDYIFTPGQSFLHRGEIAGRPYRMLIKFLQVSELETY